MSPESTKKRAVEASMMKEQGEHSRGATIVMKQNKSYAIGIYKTETPIFVANNLVNIAIIILFSINSHNPFKSQKLTKRYFCLFKICVKTEAKNASSGKLFKSRVCCLEETLVRGRV